MQIEVKDAEIMASELAYAYRQISSNGHVTTENLLTTKAKDTHPDITLYPTNSCKKYKLTLFNTDSDTKEYQDIFFNTQQQIDEENAKLTEQTINNIKDTNTASQATSLDAIMEIPGMDTAIESREPQSVFATSTQ